ncbi:MAG: hypothetical protein LBO82_05520, partial [Synergistaceae bacterium]|nr:hypothetical protein [Synergistaceae bacterium]
MLKFGLFSRKSARKMGLLAVALLLAAVPRAWGDFTITSADGTNYYYSSEVLIISADGLPPDTVISGEGEGIAVKGSGAKLTLQDLTVNAEKGPAAFWLDGSSADITIVGAVTLNCMNGDGFLVSLDNPEKMSNSGGEDDPSSGGGPDGEPTPVETVVLDVTRGSSLTAAGSGGDFCGMNVRARLY